MRSLVVRLLGMTTYAMALTHSTIATLDTLRPLYAEHGGSLEVGTPYHVLVLVILSARTRDEQVLKLAPGFFKAFPTIERLAKADVAAVMAKVNTVGMYKQKAKNLSAMAKLVAVGVGHARPGEIPGTMEGLTALPGVGRKTASVLLTALFGTPAIAVDVHVARIVTRLGWLGVKSEKEKVKSPEQIERILCDVVPEGNWADINRVFVPFGRAVCTPQPRCWSCPVVDLCSYPKKNLTPPPNADAICATILAKQEEFVRLKKSVVISLK